MNNQPESITADKLKKYSKKSIPQLLKLAETYFNRFIRERDRDGDYFYCPTCQKTKRIEGNNYHACHLFPAGHYPALRFNEDNCFGGCLQCNYYKHGMGHEYGDYVRNKIGDERYNDLLYRKAYFKSNPFKWERIALIEKIETYKNKCK
jgi:hypothetical protein